MALSLELSSLDNDTRREINRDLTVYGEFNRFAKSRKKYRLFDVDEDTVYVPMRNWNEYFDEFPENSCCQRIEVKCKYSPLNASSDPSGRQRDQDVALAEIMEKLKKDRTAFLSAFTGFGKTFSGSYLLSTLGLKTVVLCHSNSIKEQWVGEISKFTTATAKILTGKKVKDNVDVYVMGIKKACNMPREELEKFGVVIFDEAHMCIEMAYTKALLRFEPHYMIGLSATPDRLNGLHKLMESYFGKMEDYVTRFEKKPFTVIKYCTPYLIPSEYSVVAGRSKLDNITMDNKLCLLEKRTQEIVKLIESHPEHKIMVMCRRQILAKNISEAIEESELHIGTRKLSKLDKSSRVLITTISKLGTGYNDPELTMLILEADVKDVRQPEGRLRTVDCLIYDIVDAHPRHERSWKVRERWYLEKGATIHVK